MTTKNLLPIMIIVCTLGLAVHAEMTVSTADGNGADTFVGNDSNKGPDSNYGGGSTMDIRDYTNVRAHIGYVRFDISSVTSGNLTEAQLQLYITTAANSRNWNIYGLTDNTADDAWGEMAITYNTAPGMLPAALGTYTIDPAKLTLLGTLYVPAGSNYTLTSDKAGLNLDAFLGSDTNGLVTFVLIGPNDGGGSQYYAATKEGVTTPVLTLPNASAEIDTTPPAAPAGLVATAANNSVLLDWVDNAEPDVAGYKIKRSNTAGGPYTTIAVNAADSTYTDSTLTNGTTYYYVVSAVDSSDNESPNSGEVWARPQGLIRYMENLERGVVAVRKSSGAFVSWRLLGLDPAGIGFNIYRSAAGGEAVKLNSSVLTGPTCYTDTTANFAQDNTYSVRPVFGGIEQATGGAFALAANTPAQPCVVVPLGGGSTGPIHFVWVGDLDGDGQYDYVVDRLNYPDPQAIEAYHRDGTRLWSVNLGPNSTNTYNIEPGSSCVDVGHWDGVTVYDMDCDGRAEVMIRTANGVTFGDGGQLVHADDNIQFISVIDGLTGAERARIQIPTDYIADGPLAAQMGIGYLNGRTPSLVASMKNRIGDGDFNMMICAWDFDGSSLTQKWKWLRGSGNYSDGHNLRIVDVDGDGMDEVGHIGFVLDQNGTLLYNLGDNGVVHGDRWHIGKFDPGRPGLQGYGIQQSNPNGMREYYYDASTGEILWTYTGTVTDMARGDAGDMDPRYGGFEVWSFDGVWNGPSGTRITADGVNPWPCLRLWWDGDELCELFNDGKIEEWNYSTSSVSRLVTTWNYETATRSDRGAPMFYGDIWGDWREETIQTSSDYTKLVIFTTDVPTTRRLYTLAHNPEYRNSMTVKGYMQSHQVDYYLGEGMSTPPTPNIVLADSKFNPADIVEDGRVDLNDVAILSVQWMDSPGTPSADIYPSTGDGSVDELDLRVLCDNWLAVRED